MYVLPFSRSHLLDYLPKGGSVAEIGVAKGAFSEKILQRTQPDRLHLIDPWEYQDDAAYALDPSNLDTATQDQRAAAVRTKFASQITFGQVVIHRAYAHAAATAFEPGSLDWVYLDGNHTQAAVFEDLTLYSRLIRFDGLILGHDYANGPTARSANFGVVEAVDRFVADTDFQFLALTMDSYPTFLLGRPDSLKSQEVIQRLLFNNPNIIEIRAPLGRLKQRATVVAGRSVLVHSF
ncbi:class I SAM-dependent methyltransferase [Magnetospira sp. QH-2]|uniref:class I SAM-dependent methyltransferase n=1 Tax=Magnetospira sp. (strain QH-2) TaxID=1288970 RepID=UPI0003E80E89|nr:class I SAM-dependent methyltransferase [Magnetospira sp. QH-2]CCQ75651.1 conserved protein of unknown function [Magnetospira sp. QH-2]